MNGFKEYFYEAIIIPTNCKQFGTYSMNKGFWVQGAGSDLGCHKKHRHKTLKMKFGEASLMGNPGTETGYWKSGKNIGSGGGPGTPQTEPKVFDIKLKNGGAGGGSGISPSSPSPLNTKGCGGGSSSGECNQKSAGCSGYMCGTKTASGGGTETTPAAVQTAPPTKTK
jgi:hypothetical protein